VGNAKKKEEKKY